MASQVAGYPMLQSSPLSFSVDEAVSQAERAGTFLTEMLKMLEPQQIKSNETAADAYSECLKLKDYMSEQLWSICEDDKIAAVQRSLDSLTQICLDYELMKDAAEGDWDLVGHA